MSLVKIDFRSGSVRLALATQLDKSRNGKRPSATAVAAHIAMLMHDERWKTQENVIKIKEWLTKNMPTHDANALLNWFNSEDRDKTEWIKYQARQARLNAEALNEMTHTTLSGKKHPPPGWKSAAHGTQQNSARRSTLTDRSHGKSTENC